jgi:hypothetical protein
MWPGKDVSHLPLSSSPLLSDTHRKMLGTPELQLTANRHRNATPSHVTLSRKREEEMHVMLDMIQQSQAADAQVVCGDLHTEAVTATGGGLRATLRAEANEREEAARTPVLTSRPGSTNVPRQPKQQGASPPRRSRPGAGRGAPAAQNSANFSEIQHPPPFAVSPFGVKGRRAKLQARGATGAGGEEGSQG